jgi:hypothetical protein
VEMMPRADGPLSAALVIATDSVGGAANVPLTGSGPDYTMSANPASVTVQQGASATSQITLMTEAGLTGKAKLSCSVPVGSAITCTFAPSVVALGDSPVTSTVTIVAPSTLAVGTYSVTVLGAHAGLPSRETSVQVTAAQ